MDRFQRNDGYSVGVAGFDADPKRWLTLANSVVAGVVRGESVQDVGEVFAAPCNYADSHFSREEVRMRRTDHPAPEDHCGDHRRLLGEVRLLKSRFIADDLPRDQLARLLVNWIVLHIQRTDQQYREHLNAHGIR